MNELRLEAYKSDRKIPATEFYVYNVITPNVEDSAFKIVRGVCRSLSNYNSEIGIFENGKQIIASDEITNIPRGIDFELQFEEKKMLVVGENKRVYEEYIKYLIKKKLKTVKVFDKYRKYSCNSEVTSCWFLNNQGRYEIYECQDRSIRLERAFNISVEIIDDIAYLWLNTKSFFGSKLSIMDLIAMNKNVCGLEVKNEWARFSQSGTVTQVCDYTVIDKLDFGYSLKDYYIEKKKEAIMVNELPDNTPVVLVEMSRGGIILPYYPQALKPIITREYITGYDPGFSVRIDNLVKRTMAKRLQSDYEFISDIGEIVELDGLSFEKECCKPQMLGYKYGQITPPELICGGGRTIKIGGEYQVFNYGFYQKPNHKIKVGYLYPRGEYELFKQVANDIFLFATKGEYHGSKDEYTKERLIDIQVAPVIKEEYDLGNITDYKRAAYKLKDTNDIDIVIALIPDNEDEENPYNPFKKIWAEMNIPSQMITMETARLFMQDAHKNGRTSKYYLQNIVLGILGKTGGIPWIVKKMPAGVDCFVGLDVAMVERGIHYPACSVVFDSCGRMLGFFKPRIPQKGEKITTELLQDIFDQVIISYEDNFGEKPHNIVIHRDGFSNENSEWYEYYFNAQGIKYSIIEVRKNVRAKLIEENGNDLNPAFGSCVFNDKKAYLVSTLMKKRKGSPNPLLIEKNCGDVSITDAAAQVLYLTQLHVGSTQKPRLPVTTGYADKICKNLEYVPAGQVENKLFFL
ncbi:Piwi domain-containing protein [Butyrivibrio sp. INlla16]|uniref:Piwi domain-containing protein n=1 Tax=Butyrivibrio sp. INlla16 TaxID=1520807 RepID=UPI0008813B27|nr:Piwi domain-containing protein [Butyrivibrio sp. INlla16]SDB53878.1 Piwi domain-containing protein [Butyrivibrio sp. INlla16]